MTATPPTFRAVYTILAATTDPGEWWPADTPFEICVGAVLTQNTAWRNVERSLLALKTASGLEAEQILNYSSDQLEALIRPSGFQRAKARYLRHLARWFIDYHDQAKHWDTATLRTSLLQVHGVGSETADDILLYVYKRPVFIYDNYARTLLATLGYGRFSQYEQARRAMDTTIAQAHFTAQEHATFHGLIVRSGAAARQAGGWPTYWPTLVARASVDY